MNKNGVNIRSNDIYLDRELHPERGETAVNGYRQGAAPGPDLRDRKLESHDNRRDFKDGDGDISIVVQAGDELGDIAVCFQYEGQIENYRGCVAGQNALLRDGAEYLAKILSEFETGWEAEIVSAPCPKADTPIEVRAAFDRLRGVETQVQNSTAVVAKGETKVNVG
ncbi:MAG TPA: hypothetical protein VN924_33050 [Bryobacteraceae bacterium]|nr:hypothetical protein [Bryobacteraceae bacterium]